MRCFFAVRINVRAVFSQTESRSFFSLDGKLFTKEADILLDDAALRVLLEKIGENIFGQQDADKLCEFSSAI